MGQLLRLGQELGQGLGPGLGIGQGLERAPIRMDKGPLGLDRSSLSVDRGLLGLGSDSGALGFDRGLMVVSPTRTVGAGLNLLGSSPGQSLGGRSVLGASPWGAPCVPDTVGRAWQGMDGGRSTGGGSSMGGGWANLMAASPVSSMALPCVESLGCGMRDQYMSGSPR